MTFEETWPDRWIGRLLDFVCFPLVIGEKTSSKPLRAMAFICSWPWVVCASPVLLLALPLLICAVFIDFVWGTK